MLRKPKTSKKAYLKNVKLSSEKINKLAFHIVDFEVRSINLKERWPSLSSSK
jgi:hypothetical protein